MGQRRQLLFPDRRWLGRSAQCSTSTAFNDSGGGINGIKNAQIDVNSGGHLQASGSSFSIGPVDLAIGAVLNAGDLVGNAFNDPLYIPAIDVQYLSGTNSNNLSFQSIYIQPDSLTPGTVRLAPST